MSMEDEVVAAKSGLQPTPVPDLVAHDPDNGYLGDQLCDIENYRKDLLSENIKYKIRWRNPRIN